jgi:HlyD family secretion protein
MQYFHSLLGVPMILMPRTAGSSLVLLSWQTGRNYAYVRTRWQSAIPHTGPPTSLLHSSTLVRSMRIAPFRIASSCLIIGGLFVSSVFGDASSVKPEATAHDTGSEGKPSSPTTYTVRKGSLKPSPSLEAIVEATEMSPIKIEPNVWTDFTVVEIVPHGARVKKGDVIVRCDPEKLKDQLDELEQARPATAVAIELAQAELQSLQETTPQRLDAARRLQRIASEDLAYFESTGRASRERTAKFNLETATERLAYEQEELKQLEKMYKADDLTEETEEIILRRTQFSVKTAMNTLENAKLTAKRELEVILPRDEESYVNSKRDQDNALAFAEQTLPKSLAKKRYEVDKLQRDQRMSNKRLADLKKDIELMILRAPADGIVYYGACESGRWTSGPALAGLLRKLTPGGKLSGNEVFMTIVNPDNLVLKAIVNEDDLGAVAEGREGKASPVAAPGRKLAAKVDNVASVPLPGVTGFEVTISFKPIEGVRLLPGMRCKVSMAREVVLAPKDAIFGESGSNSVFVLTKEGKPVERTVTTGGSDPKMTEILGGLSEGEEILLQKPE